jgi:PmbA protein
MQKFTIKPYRLVKSSSDVTLVRYEKDILKEITSKQQTSNKLEIINQGKLGYASSSIYDKDLLFSKALASSIYGDKVAYSYPKRERVSKLPKIYSQKITKKNPDQFIKLSQRLIKSLKEVDKDILADVTVQASTSTQVVENSSGFNEESKYTSYTIYLSGELVKEGDILDIGDEYTWRDDEFNEAVFLKNLKDKFSLSKKVVSTASGKYTVVITPEVLETLLGFLETALSGHSVYKKVSKWQDKLGKQVTDSRFSLTDDPTLDYALGSTSFDDEGLVSEKINFIENGQLNAFFLDLKNASRLKMPPNGRGFGVPAQPSLTNVVIKGGEKPYRDILKNVKNGIIIQQVIGGGQDSPYSGDFSLNIHLGFLVKNGEIAGRVKDCLFSGNIFEMLMSKLGEISKEQLWFSGSYNLPYITFTDTTVIGNK